MKSIPKKSKLVKILLFIAFFAAIAIPAYNIFFIYPSFVRQLIFDTEAESIRIANHIFSHLMPMLPKDRLELKKEDISKEFVQISERLWSCRSFCPFGP